MAGQADDTDVVGKILAAELCAEPDLMCLNEQLGFQVGVAEGAACLVAGSGKAVVILDAAEFYGEEVLLCGSTADDEADVVRRTGCRSEALHLLYEERNECALVLDGGLGHGVEVGLVGGTAALGNHHEAVLRTLDGLDVDLCREVALGVHLVVHIERSILRVAEVLLGEGVEHAP